MMKTLSFFAFLATLKAAEAQQVTGTFTIGALSNNDIYETSATNVKTTCTSSVTAVTDVSISSNYVNMVVYYGDSAICTGTFNRTATGGMAGFYPAGTTITGTSLLNCGSSAGVPTDSNAMQTAFGLYNYGTIQLTVQISGKNSTVNFVPPYWTWTSIAQTQKTLYTNTGSKGTNSLMRNTIGAQCPATASTTSTLKQCRFGFQYYNPSAYVTWTLSTSNVQLFGKGILGKTLTLSPRIYTDYGTRFTLAPKATLTGPEFRTTGTECQGLSTAVGALGLNNVTVDGTFTGKFGNFPFSVAFKGVTLGNFQQRSCILATTTCLTAASQCVDFNPSWVINV